MCQGHTRALLMPLLGGVAVGAIIWLHGHSGIAFGQPRHTYAATSVNESAYAVGERVPPLNGVDFATSDRVLIAFIASNCQFCINSAPLYRAVGKERDREGSALQFVIAGREPIERLQAFAVRYHVRADRLVSVVTNHVKIRMTPTLVLLDRSGIVQAVWTGEQPGARGEAILQRLGASGS